MHNDNHWWLPTGHIFYSPDTTDTASQELAYARDHFFLPQRYRDPFQTDNDPKDAVATFDKYDLLMQESRDVIGQTVSAENDYRVLAAKTMTDPNGNRSQAAFDNLGMVVATAIKSKPGENLGDLIDDTLATDLDLPTLQAFIANPDYQQKQALLGNATTRILYDLDRYQRCGQPPFAATLARETHFHEPNGAQSKIQVGFSYSDGFGREIQKKIQAESGNAPQRGNPITLATGDSQPGVLQLNANGKPLAEDTLTRWVGNGRTVFNNKGKPVKQYEPFFSSTHLYEPERDLTDTGVSPTLFYDPIGRVVATLHPNHSWEKVVFNPWQQTIWDVNDTLGQVSNGGTFTPLYPNDDPDVGSYFQRIDPNDYFPTWHALRTDPAHAALAQAQWDDPKLLQAERTAALQTQIHAATPAVAHADALGRTFLTRPQPQPIPQPANKPRCLLCSPRQPGHRRQPARSHRCQRPYRHALPLRPARQPHPSSQYGSG